MGDGKLLMSNSGDALLLLTFLGLFQERRQLLCFVEVFLVRRSKLRNVFRCMLLKRVAFLIL